MKKRFSGLTVGIIAFLMLVTGVAASGYYHWTGSQNFDDSMNTMDKIQIGIGLLKGDLEDEQDSHEETKNKLDTTEGKLEAAEKELNDLKDKIAKAGTSENENGEEVPFDIDDLISERNTLQNNINSIVTTTNKYVGQINDVSGKGSKYDKLFELLTKEKLDTLYNYSDIAAMEKNYLSDNPGNGPTDKQLQQAIEDMKKVKDKSDSTLGAFDEDTKTRINEAHESKDYTSVEEETTVTDEENN